MKETTLALAAALDPSTPGRDLIPFDRRLIDQAMREGVAGILYKRLLASGVLDSLDQGHRGILQAFYYQTIRMNLRLMHALKQVLFQANQRGVTLVVLQGMDLLNDPYEDIGLRPMTDIDLWVSREDYQELVHILEVLGYERDDVYASTFKQGSTVFDIHTHILWADRIRARKLLLGGSEEHLIGKVRTIKIEGEKALCLSPYDQVLYLSLHAFKHRAERLIWLVDIKRLLERWNAADWESLVRRAEDLGQRKTLTYIFFLLEEVFHFRIPWDALKLLQKRKLSPLEKKILRERVKKGALPLWGPVLLFSSELGPVKRVLFLFENLYPRIEILRQVFPSPPNLRPWQLYGKRTLQLLGMLKRAIRNA
ncbi:MAG: hypothetical protein A2170_14720 [Deltaproteobacteria bacterium RBG_13_53_10]|nr:MAG: hypothetical protein A2170_14720 [Deltaproteobacteria bacterium RBG_13_53_10]